MKLEDQVAVVTGGGRGIGEATCLWLNEEGCSVVVAARTRHEIEEVAREISASGGEALAVTTDVRYPEGVEELVERCVKAFGRVDIMINNVGVGYRKSFTETTESELLETIDTDLSGVLLCSRAVLPHMLYQGSGRIVSVSSEAGKHGFPNLAAYCASKLGVVGFTEALAKEVERRGVKVYAVCPGWVDTEMHTRNYPEDDPALLLKPVDLAERIVELCMPDCRVSPGRCVSVSRNPISSLADRILG